ncbi:nuclear receptor coactivator 7 isoform X7 [Bradysia coprophila]|uniref:nuclear receptor coactivator 7 isoform X7 n=1 Tax=Bradysia coprophila TaxID=38358 RepID=UPI00187DAA99|nr:nuclear receptor coactivator 7 isoform X7 [Bradysia coprophila]
MTSIMSHGKYRQRTNSIPTLFALEEECIPGSETHNGIPPKPPRRSSLALNLLGNRGPNPEKHTKRRSSIAVAFLGRHNKHKDASYEVAVISEKSDSTQEITRNNDGLKWSEDETMDNSDEDVEEEEEEEDDDVENDETNDDEYDDNKQNSSNDDTNKTLQKVVKEKRRRESWQIKLDRRRRKGLLSSNEDDEKEEYATPPEGYGRQKRHSWWNIFVPENLKHRSRRASTDVGLSLSSDNIAPRPFRSKSRSVDHGLAAPYDLDSLRSKVEGRFDSVERLSKDGKQRGSIPSIPTKSYTVGNRDTLTSVAARFDTTPSELTSINKLNSSFIYPGQQLLVPDKSAAREDGDDASGKSSPTDKTRKSSSDEIPLEEKELLDGLRPSSPRPGHMERISSPNVHNDDDPVITQRFLKINVRHITDGQGVVGGVLLVTPNAVMFDPNVSDPLVIEHGPESYGVIAPMELVVNAAIFHDIAHMKICGDSKYVSNTHVNPFVRQLIIDVLPSSSTEKAEIYYPKQYIRCESSHSPGKDSLLVKDETFPELGVTGSVEGCDDQESVCSSNDREGDAFPKAFERELVTPTNLQKAHADSTESCGSADKPSSTEPPNNNDDNETSTADQTKDNKAEDVINSTVKTDDEINSLGKELRSLEERRRSLLDHHWAVPSKESRSIEDDSIESTCPEVPVVVASSLDESNNLTKQSCHDSGIDIRDPPLPQVPAKKNYSDADIILSSDWAPPLTIAPALYTESPPSILNAQSQAQSQNLESGGRKKTSSVSFSVEDGVGSSADHSSSSDKSSDNKKNKMLKRLSYPLTWVEGLTGDGKPAETESAPNTGDSNQSVFSKVFSRRSSIGTFIRPHSSEGTHPTKPNKAPPPKLDYRSMVSIDDMPELFVSFDKLIPRPARACADPPLYLRLRMGRPIGKAMPLPTAVMSYGKNKLKTEFIFSIPKNRTDELYRFLNTWVPHLYGELDEEQITARGFELIQHDTEWVKGGQSKDGRTNSDGEDITELTRESWEVLSMSTDEYRKASLFASGSFDLDFPIPDLIGTTEILTEEHREKLCGHLPARAEGYSWSLVFSTSQHGFSLNSLYRKMQRLESPVLVVIEDTEHNVFGALTSCSLHASDHFYGTGESLLFKFNPSFKVFHWTGENLYFIKGNPESLSIGAGDGKFGLWLDGDLNQGRSQKCSTYANEALAPEEDFVIKTLECWAFV